MNLPHRVAPGMLTSKTQVKVFTDSAVDAGADYKRLTLITFEPVV